MSNFKHARALRIISTTGREKIWMHEPQVISPVLQIALKRLQKCRNRNPSLVRGRSRSMSGATGRPNVIGTSRNRLYKAVHSLPSHSWANGTSMKSQVTLPRLSRGGTLTGRHEIWGDWRPSSPSPQHTITAASKYDKVTCQTWRRTRYTVMTVRKNKITYRSGLAFVYRLLSQVQ